MVANPIWIAAYGGPPPTAIGAAPVWIAPGDGSVPSAVASQIVGYGGPVAGASPVWIAAYGGAPPAGIGATPITLAGYGSGGSGGGGATSVWSAADAAANAMTLTNGGLTVTPSTAGGYQTVRGTLSNTAGKFYIEFNMTGGALNGSVGDPEFGIATAGFSPLDYIGHNPVSAGTFTGATQLNPTNPTADFTSNYLSNVTPSLNDVFAIAVDFSSGKYWLAQNNVWLGSGNPGTGANPMLTIVGAGLGLAYFPAMTLRSGASGTGVWTLQPTAASQKYAPPSGFTAWDGGAAHSSQALAYLARTVGGNEGGNGTNIANLIDGLVSDGVWSKLDCLYVLAQQNATDAVLNLVGTSYPMTILGGSPSFTAYVGYVLNNAFLSSGFTPSSAPSPNYTQNSASIGVWMFASRVSSDQSITNTAGGSGIYYNYPSTPNLMIASLNGGQNHTNTPGTTGLYVADRSLSTNHNNYCNGVNQGLGGGASSAVDTGQFVLAGTPQTISAAFISASLGSAGQLALYNRLRTYMTAVGVP